MQTLYRFKGTVETTSQLELIENRVVGDVYKCEADLHDYIWNGQDWVDIGQNVDFTEIMQKVDDIESSQQDLLDDMSKTYTGTNITANTVEGYGTINKLYGHTVEEGSGEKSPTNPYTLKCVADDVNLFDANKIEKTTKNGITCTVSDGVMTFNGTCTQDNTGFVAIFNSLVKNIKEKTNIFIEYLSGTIENATNTTVYSMFETGFEYQMYSKLLMQNMKHVSNFDDDFNFYAMQIRFDNGVKANNYKIRIKVSQVDTDVWSPYNKGIVEIISKNGDNQSANVVATKPLCYLKDTEGNIIAQDYIDYARGVVHRECGYEIFDGTQEWYSSSYTNDTYLCALAYIANTDSELVLCDRLAFGNYTQVTNKECIASIGGGAINIRILKSRLETPDVAGLKKWLATNNLIVIYKLATPNTESIDCSNKIVQYGQQTTVSNRDGAKIEVSLTNNEAISGLNENIGNVENIVNKMSNYSTEEQVVGTWIDGKPLYRRVFEISSSERASFEDNLVQNIDMGMLLGGYILTGGGTKHSVELNGSYRISVKLGNNMYFVSDATNMKIVKYSIIVIYTKTTD